MVVWKVEYVIAAALVLLLSGCRSYEIFDREWISPEARLRLKTGDVAQRGKAEVRLLSTDRASQMARLQITNDRSGEERVMDVRAGEQVAWPSESDWGGRPDVVWVGDGAATIMLALPPAAE